MKTKSRTQVLRRTSTPLKITKPIFTGVGTSTEKFPINEDDPEIDRGKRDTYLTDFRRREAETENLEESLSNSVDLRDGLESKSDDKINAQETKVGELVKEYDERMMEKEKLQHEKDNIKRGLGG